MINELNEIIYDYIFSSNIDEDYNLCKNTEKERIEKLNALFKSQIEEKTFWDENRYEFNDECINYSFANLTEPNRIGYNNFPRMKSNTKINYLEYKTDIIKNNIQDYGNFDRKTFMNNTITLSNIAKKELLDYAEKRNIIKYKNKAFLAADDNPAFSIIYGNIIVGEAIINSNSKDNIDSSDIKKEIERLTNFSVYQTKIPMTIDPDEAWFADVRIFADKYVKDHPLYNDMNTSIFHKRKEQLMSLLFVIGQDEEFIMNASNNGEHKDIISSFYENNKQSGKEYDVFISHANADKEDYVEKLYESLAKYSLNIFYDKNTIEWGDNWKQKILEGTNKSEFAIIIISNNFFGREWTEKELYEFLNRQNTSGQKIILPILHKVTIDDLKAKYPSVANIQALNTEDKNCDEIAIEFIKQLIKRLKKI